jgi:hypothetical protein
MKSLSLAASTALFIACALPALPAAEVFQVTRATKSALPAGKEADGMIGDWLIRNDRVVAVIGQTSAWREANQMVEGVQGAVLDFTSLGAPDDQLVVLYPMGYRPTGVSANRVEVVQARGNTASFKVIRDATPDEPYTSTTIYTLNDGEPFLRLQTTHENTSAAPVEVAVHDWLRLDNDSANPQPVGDLPVVLLENKWYRAAYGLGATDGRAQRAVKDLDQKDFRAMGVLVHYPAVNPEQKATVTIVPGRSVGVDRRLFAARDAAGVQTAASRALGRKPPAVRLRAIEVGGAPVADVHVDVKQNGDYVTAAVSADDGGFTLPLSDGTYDLAAVQIGRPTVTRSLTVAGGRLVGEDELLFAPASRIALDVAEAGTDRRLPVKLEFRSRNGGSNPFLGPSKRARGAGNHFFSVQGRDTFSVPAGEYVVHVSHSPEYEVVLQELNVAPGTQVDLKARLRREIESPNWIIADLHNHSTGSGDSNAETPARVLNAAAAGIQFAPATEHNRISTFTPHIEALGLRDFIASCPGIELSGRPGPNAINHQNAFPLLMHDDQQGYGAPRTDADPGVQMRRLFDLDGGSPKLMQQNHPDIGWLYFDRDRDGVIDGGFGTRPITQVMEIRETMLLVLADTDPATAGRTSRVFHWLQMLNQGDRIFATANSDTHTIGPESGSIFNYIHVANDDIATLDPWEIVRSVQRGRVVISNGPFLETGIGDAMPGDTLAVPSGSIEVKIRVRQASWSRIDRVQILVNGRQLAAGNFTRRTHPQMFGDGVVQFEHSVPVQLDGDAQVIVVAAGEGETIANRTGGRFMRNQPMALSNPIFVDVDGGGFKANGDMLGAPLPTGKARSRP